MKGLFITLEGIEGCGKSTQAKLLKEYFEKQGREVILTREPGGTELGASIRRLLLESGHVYPIAELLLFLADRNQHVREMIVPALEKGAVVICDRYYHSTFAYQAAGRKVGSETVKIINDIAMEGTKPLITFLIDIPVDEGFRRKKANRMELDRIEREKKDFHETIRAGYLELAGKDPSMTVIDGMLPREEIHRIVADKIARI